MTMIEPNRSGCGRTSVILAITLPFVHSAVGFAGNINELNLPDLESLSRSVVLVRSGAYRGSGFSWKEPHQIITSWHVINDKNIFVTFPDRNKVVNTMFELRAKVSCVLPSSDLVWLTVEDPTQIPDTVEPLDAINDRPTPLENIYAIGFPLSLTLSDTTPLTYLQSNKLIDLIDDKGIRSRLRSRSSDTGLDVQSIVL